MGYGSTGHSSQTLQIQPSLGHDDSNTISIGAGYSVGGAKGALSFGGLAPASGLHYEGGHQTLQLPAITLQPSHGNVVAGDISQLMSQLTHGLSTGALQLQPVGGQHYSAVSYGQESSQPQYSFGVPKLQQYSVSEQQSSVPTYAAGTKGLGSYSGGATGPVLFNPADSSQYAHSAPSYAAGAGYSLGDSSLGSSGHSFGGASFKALSGNFGSSGKTNFKPSAFLGASVQNEGTHGISALSTHAIPSFGNNFGGAHAPISLGSGGHGGFGGNFGSFGGSSKFVAPSYLPPKSFGSSLEAISAFSGSGHSASPPSTTYGFPAASHGASSSPQYYFAPSKQVPSFGEGSSSFKAPISGHSALSSFSSGPKYSFGGHGAFNTRFSSKDSQGAYSEPAYNTIKYSEELRPRVH